MEVQLSMTFIRERKNYIRTVKLKNLLYAFVVALSFYGCENEIDINAPYKEIPFVYALLDPSEPVQYIRIQKLYQNSVNQTTQEGAQYPDSLYYDSLQVTVKSLSTGIDYVFTKTNEFAKNTGFFTSQGHIIYKSNLQVSPFENYELTIFHPSSGNIYKAVTSIVEPMTIRSTGFIFDHTKPTFLLQYIIDKFGQRAAIHDSYFRFRYTESLSSGSGPIDTITLDYVIKKEETVDAAFQRTSNKSSITCLAYKNFLLASIPDKPGYIRKYIDLQRVSISGSSFLKDVIELSKDNGGFIDKKRDYSNISGGAQGIFSSRAKSFNTVTFSDQTTTDMSRKNLLSGLPQFVYP